MVNNDDDNDENENDDNDNHDALSLLLLSRTEGHSLGGALACLCSVELQAGINELSRPDPADGSSGRSSSDTDVLTYTFGAPRVGNVTFGTYADSLLSNYWHVVTTEDPVARYVLVSGERSDPLTPREPAGGGSAVIRHALLWAPLCAGACAGDDDAGSFRAGTLQAVMTEFGFD